MNKVYKKHFKLVALVWASCFVLSLLIYMMVLVPQREHKKQIDQQLAEKEKMYETILKINQRETRALMNKEMEQLRDKLKDFVAAPEDLAGLTFDIGQIANDIKISSFSIKPQSNLENRGSTNQYICENQMRVSFKADFNKFAAFLNAMERHRPVIFVDKFEITQADQHDDLVSKVSMNLSVFVKRRQGS